MECPVFTALKKLAGEQTDVEFLPFLADASAGEGVGLPIAGTTRIDFPNNHLQYAITWYGLALALAGVGGYFFFAGRREQER